MANTDTVPARPAVRLWVLATYFLSLLLFARLGAPGWGSLTAIPVNFLLKDQWHFGPSAVSVFALLAGIPIYLGALLGVLRDRWQPFGGRDRVYLIGLPVAICLLFASLRIIPLKYGSLLAVMFVAGAMGVLLQTAIQGLMTSAANHHRVAGKISVVFTASFYVPTIIGSYAGGWLTERASPEAIFLLTGLLLLPVLPMAIWPPQGVHPTGSERDTTPQEPLKVTVRRLLGHRPMLLPAILVAIWNFAPGWATPLFFFQTDHVGMKPEQIGIATSIAMVGTLVTVFLYGVFTHRVAFRRLIWAGYFVSIIGGPIYAFIDSPWQAYAVGAFVGLTVGFYSTALTDLLVRTSPRGAEGVATALTLGAGMLTWNVSDVFGAWLYTKGGFGLAMAVTLAVAFLAIPFIRMLPAHIGDSRDGEDIPETAAPLPVSAG